MNQHLKNIGKAVGEAAKAGSAKVVETMVKYPRSTFAAGVIVGIAGTSSVLKLSKRKAAKSANKLTCA